MSQLDSIIEQLKAEIEAAYQRGYAAGADNMRKRIMEAAQLPAESPNFRGHSIFHTSFVGPPFRAVAKGFNSGDPAIGTSGRAPRGAVARLLDRVLSDYPEGLAISEIEAIANDYDEAVALKSIGNELRRAEGDKYRRDETNKWFLIGENAETEMLGQPAKTNPNIFE